MKPVSLCALDKTRLVVFCSKPEGAELQIVDTAFGVTVQRMRAKSVLSAKVCCFLEEYVLFKQAKNVACWRVSALPQGLAQLVGSGQDGCSELKVAKGDLKWTPLNIACLRPDSILKSVQDLDNCLEMVSSKDLPPLVRLGFIESLCKQAEDNGQLGRLFQVSMTREDLIPLLTQLDFSMVRKLISNILEMLEEDDVEEQEFEAMLLWLETLLEAHYSAFVVSREPECVALLQQALDLVTGMDNSLNLMASVMVQTKMMRKRQAVRKAQNKNMMYSVDRIYL